jgi:polyhydroxyalkanoate synthesis repressor PhaR
MNEVRIIKKYPNRRLYDSAESRYITLNDIRQLVIDEQPFEVIDKKTGRNITRSILLQVITEQELGGHAVLSEDFLARIIRCARGTPPELVRAYLEDSLGLFLEQQGCPLAQGFHLSRPLPADEVTALLLRN